MEENIFRVEPESLLPRPRPMSIQSSELQQQMDLEPEFQNVSHHTLIRAANPSNSGSPGYIDQKKRSIGSLQSQPDLRGFVESTSLEIERKRMCREEKMSDQEDGFSATDQRRKRTMQSSAAVEQCLESALDIEHGDGLNSEKAEKRSVSGDEDAFVYRTTQLDDQFPETHGTLDEERKEVEALHLHSKLCEEGVGGVEREVLDWESPFQYAQLSSLTPRKPLSYKNTRHESSVAEYRQSDALPDLEIRGRGSTSVISCHSSVLCVVSSVIKTRLASKLHHGSELNFENIPHEALIQLVGYAETGHITLDEASVLSVYSAADFLDIEYVTTVASTFLSERTEMFDGVSCYKVLRYLEQHDKLQLLVPMYKRRAMEHAAELFNSVECLMDMSMEFVIEFLESDFVDFGPEVEVVRALNRWVSVDPSREEYMSELATRIRWNEIEQEPLSEDVKVFKCKHKSAGSSCDKPKIGSRNEGMSGGFLISYHGIGSPLLLDIKSRAIKVLPNYPKSTCRDCERKDVPWSDVHVADSDDGAFYVVLEFGECCNPPNSFDLLRLNVPKHCWDCVFEYRTGNWKRRGVEIRFCVLAGMLCLTWYLKNDVDVQCYDLTTLERKFSFELSSVSCGYGVSGGLSSIFYLEGYTSGKLRRFNAKTRNVSKVKIDIPAESLKKWKNFWVNDAGQAVIHDGKTQFLVCLESGRLIHSRPMEYIDDNLILIQDSILNMGFYEDNPPSPTHDRLEIFRDRGALAGWNSLHSCSLISPNRTSNRGCHFARALIKDLPDFHST